MSTYTLKSLGNDFLEDSSMQQEQQSEQTAEDRSSFKLVGLKDQNAAKQSIVRISHKRHPDPSTRTDTKSRVFGTATPAEAPASKETGGDRPAAGQRMGENRDPAERLPNETWANRRNPVTGQGLTPVEPGHGGRTHNIRNKSSITFITSPE